MRVDCGAGGIGDVKGHKLEPLLGDTAGGLQVVDDVPLAAEGHNHHGVAINVVPELVLGDEHGVEKFLMTFWVAGLRIQEDLADEVHRMLNFEGMALLLPFHD